jgi:nucleotide-binding universal stress UspA family protein
MADPAPRRLLVPVAAATEASRGLTYARQCQAAGLLVEVCLLHVIEPVEQWQVLRFLTRDEVAAFQEQRAADCLERSSAALAADQIPCRVVVRRGHLAESIIDAAEALGCAEIVMPRPGQVRCGWLAPSLAARVVRRSVRVPVTLVQ